MISTNDVRRSPRLRLRAPAELTFRGTRHAVVAEDVGVDGCRITAPLAFRRGEGIYLTLFLHAPGATLSAAATVVWSTARTPHRTGVAFARGGASERARCLGRLLERDPALAHAPAPLRPHQRLRLGPPPPPAELLGRDEFEVLRATRDGTTVLSLLDAAGARFREILAALDALRAHGVVREGRPGPTPPVWVARLAANAPEPPPRVEPVAHPFSKAGRPLRATFCIEAARRQGAHGHLAAAVEWLQVALAAAPDDTEIAEALEGLTGGEPAGG